MSCGVRTRTHFEVIPKASSHLLRSPDSTETPFPGVLRAYNGFEAGKGWINLTPLMDLRIENAYYVEGASRRGLKGYLGTEVARYRVRPDGLKLLSVQPMPGRPPGDTPVQQLISDSMLHMRFYRMYYEVVFNRTTDAHGSVLLGAATGLELDQLSAALMNTEAACGPASIHCTAFPEACSVSVEMELRVNGKEEAVVWGSQLVQVVGEHPSFVRVKRLFGNRLLPVMIERNDAGALRLPLLPGDKVEWK